jgi:hypothetical protein
MLSSNSTHPTRSDRRNIWKQSCIIAKLIVTIAQLLIAPRRSRKEKMETHKGMYNGREGMSSLSLPRYLEKAQDIIVQCIISYCHP